MKLLLHRLLSLLALVKGALFVVWCRLVFQDSRFKGIPKCYSWPSVRASAGKIYVGRRVVFGGIKLVVSQQGVLTIGDNVSINDGAVLGVLSSISIGENTSIAENVMIRDHDHSYRGTPLGDKMMGYEIANVRIGRGCWLGYGAVVVKGVVLHDGVVVGANAVVTKACSQGQIVVGATARVIQR